MSEIWDLVDKDKNKIGTTYERNCGTPIPKGMYHLAVEIWTIKPNGGILLTQRHQNKNYGLMWEATGGAVLSGESSIQGAVRELYEETGITVEMVRKYMDDETANHMQEYCEEHGLT